MGIKKRILLNGLEKVREENERLSELLEDKKFNRKYPKWQYSDVEREKKRHLIEVKIERNKAVLEELRKYLGSEVSQ